MQAPTLDLAPGPTRFDEGLALRTIGFIRRLKHTAGAFAGQWFNLRVWEILILAEIFGRVKISTGLRAYRTAYIEIPRKNGKTELAAAMVVKLLFDDQEPGAQIYSAANDREQASLVFQVVAEMVRQEPALLRRCKIIDSQKRIVVYDTASFYRVLSADVKTKHGFNAHGVVYDEIHEAPHRRLYDVLASSMGSRTQPLMVVITTAGYDRTSICWELHEYATKILRGDVVDPSFYAYIACADEADDWTSEETWRKANPNYGVSIQPDFLRSECLRAIHSPALQNTFRRLYLNQWTSQDERWLDMARWDASAGAVDPEALRGHDCYGGLDLASTTDFAALSLVFPPPADEAEGAFQVLPYFWIPRETMKLRPKKDQDTFAEWARLGLLTLTEGDTTDYQAISETIHQVRKLYRLREIGYDRWEACQLVQDLEREKFKMVPIGQGFASMNVPTKAILRLTLARRFWHGGHPILRAMADNLRVAQDPAGCLKPDKARSGGRIDGMVASIMGLDRAMRNGKKRSVYAARGQLQQRPAHETSEQKG